MLVFRLLMILVGLVAGYAAGRALNMSGPNSEMFLVNTVSLMLAGALLAFLVTPRLEPLLSRSFSGVRRWYSSLAPRTVAAATFGLIVALLLSVLVSNLLASLPIYSWPISILVTLVLAWFFVNYSVQHADAFGLLASQQVRRKKGSKVLDTNVIIDGRVVELAKAGFLEGELLIPSFVLRELQLLADHSDAQRRTRGKRGLAVLEELQELRPLRIDDWDEPGLDKVDDKLIRFARETGGKIVSNDNALSRIAKLQGVEVLSIHEAAVALKPQVQAGDYLTITVSKGGQQQGQGVGYLEDGTMVVVEDGLKFRGKPLRVLVVNNVQTNVGRMIFAKPDQAA
ncbi:PIN/TRAM domain-containing protein [Deinococcus radiophilus]|uniref:PIN/TRAM domain-containing protein n=1 Tax=Deinococcus radiophilus TaxID=32062 RepID=A0A3S0KC25_9DEIO|nr:PIN domain-containing protein [Deinococcus radiophilus]RTR27270.1 PIN/TRAM domain-containing protein [Deinococcus radiophilus]UFA50647.1 PIN/TRAM domain-containing protein [Deinococcus radiophilus]